MMLDHFLGEGVFQKGLTVSKMHLKFANVIKTFIIIIILIIIILLFLLLLLFVFLFFILCMRQGRRGA